VAPTSKTPHLSDLEMGKHEEEDLNRP